MTGADVKRQVMEALNNAYRREGYGGGWLLVEDEKSIDALAPCIVLTAEEAAAIHELAESSLYATQGDASEQEWIEARPLLALLTPDQEGQR